MREIFYDWGGLNLLLFHAINNIRGEFVDGFMQLGSLVGEHTLFPLYLGLVAVTAMARVARAPAAEIRNHAMVWLGVVTVFAFCYAIDGPLVSWLKTSLDFPRPPALLPPESLHVIGRPEYRHSLPSGHAVFAMTVAASLWPILNRAWRVGLAVFVLWVGISRVSLGAHFPADVLAGYLTGLAVVLVVSFVIRRTMSYFPG